MPDFSNNSQNNEVVYSHQINDIISQKPSWIVQNGIGLFLVILCGILAMSYFVQYPDIVIARARLVSVNPPIELKTKLQGKLLRLNVAENDSVQQGQTIAVMESVASVDKIQKLYTTLSKVKRLIDSGKLEQALKVYDDKNREVDLGTGLGEVQEAYHSFKTACGVFSQYLNEGFYLKKYSMLQADIQFLQRMQQNYGRQKEMLTEDLELASKNFLANEKLNKDNVVADVEYRNEKSKYIGRKMTIPQINASIINNELALHEKRKEILQLDNEIVQQKVAFAEALNSFMAVLEQWQVNYLVRAPFSGRVAFADFVQANQYYPANQTICYLNPGHNNFYAQAWIKQYNFGKIKKGQTVLLKLASYPYNEFGTLKGTLSHISNLPTDSGFAAKIELPRGLVTSQHFTIHFREQLIGDAEIITDNRKLIQRFLSSLKGMLNR